MTGINNNAFQTEAVSFTKTNSRKEFYKKTFGVLALSLGVFAAICWALLSTGVGLYLTLLMGASSWGLLITFGLFIGISYLASSWAANSTSTTVQILGLGLYVLLQAIITTPLLITAQFVAGTEIIAYAGLMTGVLAAGLIFMTFLNKWDFSFLNGFLFVASMVVFGVIITSLIFGFQLGIWFSAAMIAFASVAILKDASDVQHRFSDSQYIAAALTLFSSIALLFFYVLRLLTSLSGRD